MASPKPILKKPAAPRKPTVGVKEPMPKIIGKAPAKKTPMPKGITVAISKGVTMDARTGVKTTAKPTPTPIKTKSNAQYFADQKAFIASQKKSKGK